MRCDALILGVGSAGRVVELDGRLRGVEPPRRRCLGAADHSAG